MKTATVTAGLAAGLALAATPAFAHGGEAMPSLGSGLLHPLTGLDHVLAMGAVGLWAGIQGGRATWALPAAFLAMTMAGAGLAVAGWTLPLVEAGILASVVIVGLLVARMVALPAVYGAALVGAFAVLHGQAHGADAPAGLGAVLYAAGFVLTTAGLLVAGLGLAALAGGRLSPVWVRGAGAVTAACGLVLAVI